MALNPCRECGDKVSSKAKTCPHCGIKRPVKPKSVAGSVLLGIIGLGIVAALFSPRFNSTGSAPPPSSSSNRVDLNASVNFDGAQFTIVNADSFAWAECKLDLNGGLVRSGYLLNAGRLEAGSTYTVGSVLFANGDGERFNPFTMKPQNLLMRCDTPQGRGSFSGEWN